MKKKDRIWIILFASLFALLVAVEYNAPEPVNWSATFSKNDKIPYGNYVLYDYLTDMFPGKEIKPANKGIYNTLSNDYEQRFNNYIFITEEFSIDTLNMNYLLNFVRNGHSVFIAAEYFSEAFADTLKFKYDNEYNLNLLGKDSTSINFTATSLHSEKNFRYRKGTVENFFKTYDSAHVQVLGENSLKRANYIAVSFGEGTFYLSSIPYAFTNYNALKGDNGEYMYRALSYLPVADTYWDEYYKPGGHMRASTPLAFVLSNTPLKYAYYLLLFTLLLYIIFEGKRKQRIIPIIKPLQNTSVEFVETIGRLYYQKGSSHGIAQKKILFFLDHVRSRYNVATSEFNNQFYLALASKTLIPIEDLKKLFNYIARIQAMPAIDEIALLTLNDQIENFYRKTQ